MALCDPDRDDGSWHRRDGNSVWKRMQAQCWNGRTLSHETWKPGRSGRNVPPTGRDRKASARPANPHAAQAKGVERWEGEKSVLSLLTSHARFAARAPIVKRHITFLPDTSLYTCRDRLRIENRNDGWYYLNAIADKACRVIIDSRVSDIEDVHTVHQNRPTSVVIQ